MTRLDLGRWLGCMSFVVCAACSSHTSKVNGVTGDAGVDDDSDSRGAGRGGRAAAGSGGRKAGAAGKAGSDDAGDGDDEAAGKSAAAGGGGAGGRVSERGGAGGSKGGSGGFGGSGGAGVGAGGVGAGGVGGKTGTGGAGAAGSDEGAAGDSAGTGGDAAGGAGGDAAGSGGSDAPPDTTKLTEIATDAQAQAVCSRIGAVVDSLSWGDARSGVCARRGLAAEAGGMGTCAAVQQECVAEPSTETGCSPESIPDCADVTIDEYVACTIAEIQSYIEENRSLTCDTAAGDVPAQVTPAGCDGPYERCPAIKRF
jgi:hypothetical protein